MRRALLGCERTRLSMDLKRPTTDAVTGLELKEFVESCRDEHGYDQTAET